MAGKKKAFDVPTSLHRLERAAGVGTEGAVVTLLPAWAVWLLNHQAGQPFPTWSWVVIPAVLAACWVRSGWPVGSR